MFSLANTLPSPVIIPQNRSLDGELAIPFPSRANETTLEENMESISAIKDQKLSLEGL